MDDDVVIVVVVVCDYRRFSFGGRWSMASFMSPVAGDPGGFSKSSLAKARVLLCRIPHEG